MRNTTDLLDWPFTLWQLPALTGQQFIRAARDRGVHLMPEQLEGLHRLRILTPFLRVQRDGRAIAAAARRQDPGIWEMANWQFTGRGDLVRAHQEEALHDPNEEGFIARRRLERTIGEVRYQASEFLYSRHQLLALGLVAEVLPALQYGPEIQVKGVKAHPIQRANWERRATHLRSLAIVLSALEPVYYPDVIRRIRFGPFGEQEAYDRWLNRLRPTELTRWLELEPPWFKDRAFDLLLEAEFLDPLRNWARLVAQADSDRWGDLRNDARRAIDLRVAAEMFLRYYERLAQARKAPAIKKDDQRTQQRLAYRLKATGRIDPLLTDFGLSPHPRLILVVEGETELEIVPRVRDYFKIRADREFIAIENAIGVGRDLSALVAYAIAPQSEPGPDNRYLELVAPPTRLLVMMDAEGDYATEADRQRRREIWIDRIMATFAQEHRTEAVREAVGRLVDVATWNNKGDNFEFAHFTDRQLARAMAAIDRRDRQPTFEKRIELTAKIRAQKSNLKNIMGKASKVELARELWPVLERKIKRAEKQGTEGRIPVVRGLDLAIKLAHELPRNNLVITIEDS
jgi:hypothetical protein